MINIYIPGIIIAKVMAVPTTINDIEDKLVWIFSKGGNFMLQSAPWANLAFPISGLSSSIGYGHLRLLTRSLVSALS